MDLMILGETVRSVAPSTTHVGYWMPAGGNECVAGLDASVVTGTFTVHLQTKNSEDADPAPGVNIIGYKSVTATGMTTFEATGAKELVRYLITSTATATLHFQFLQPQWFPN